MLAVVSTLPRQWARLAYKRYSRHNRFGDASTLALQSRGGWNADLTRALGYALLIPVFPLLGYMGLDQTGISAWLVAQGWIPQAILGEGFGHVGLCFSLHYVIAALRSLWSGLRVMGLNAPGG